MKYEAVFGDQKRFNEQNNEMTEVMLWHDYFGPNFVSIKELSQMTLEGAIPHGSVVLAMRRIIQEPKRWTVEDQKAGRLPEVGAELLHESEGCVNFVGEFDFRWMLRTKEGGLYLAEKFYCSPIETPEEKSARLREEWCIKALSSCSISSGMQKYELTRLGGYIEDIYDALLSGELQAPKGE